MFSWTLITLVTLAINLAAAAPAPWDKDSAATYSGSGGKSGGGSVEEPEDTSLLGAFMGRPVLNAWSDNAGNGGQAGSGGALVSGEGLHGHGKFPQTNNDAAYTGGGGDAQGGSYTGKSAYFNLFGSNAGNGGSSESGPSDVVEALPELESALQ